MCLGQDKLLYHMKDYEKRMDTLSKKEQDTYRDMKVVREMYARGFEFLPIDIYESGANRFKIKDGKLLPSLSTVSRSGRKGCRGSRRCGKRRPVPLKRRFPQPYKGQQNSRGSVIRPEDSRRASGVKSAVVV